jgi:sarcosine oxidase, subunit beta
MGVRYVEGPPRSADLVVVGGGIVGAATAFYAAHAGLRVALVEKRRALCTLTTPASTGAFRLQFDNREELELVRESVDLFSNFSEATRQDDYDLDLRRRGYLWVTTSEERAAEQRALVARQHEWGLGDVEIVSGDDARARWPYLDPAVVQARWRGNDGFLDPKRLTMGLAAASGAAVALDSEVVGFDVRSGVLHGVTTTRGRIAAPAAVIAAGPFSGVVAARAQVRLPIETVARHKVVFADLPAVPEWAPMTIDDDTGAHWRPALHGAYCLFTDPTTPPSPPTDNVAPDHAYAVGLLDPASPKSVARVAPLWRDVWRANGVVWLMQSGQYTMTPDHRPLLGPTEIDGLFVNTGYSGHGIMASPAGSRHLVDVVLGRIPDDGNVFRLDRPFEPRTRDLL